MAAEKTRETGLAGKPGSNGNKPQEADASFNNGFLKQRYPGGKRQAAILGALERSYSAAFLVKGPSNDKTKLVINRDAPSGGVKLELRNDSHYNSDGDQEDETGAAGDEDCTASDTKSKTSDCTTGKLTGVSATNQTPHNQKTDNKMSLDELLVSNHSRIQKRRRRFRQKQQGKELRKTLSYGQMNKLSQSMNSTDIFNLKRSLHGVYRNRHESNNNPAAAAAAAATTNQDDKVPLRDPSLSLAQLQMGNGPSNHYQDHLFFNSFAEDDDDCSSYEEMSYESSCCASSLPRSEDGIAAVDLDNNDGDDNSDDATECSGYSIGIFSDYCHSSITMEDWQSLCCEFDESFAIEVVQDNEDDDDDDDDKEEMVAVEPVGEYEELMMEDSFFEVGSAHIIKDFGESRSVFTEEVLVQESASEEVLVQESLSEISVAPENICESRSISTNVAVEEEVVNDDDDEYREFEVEELDNGLVGNAQRVSESSYRDKKTDSISPLATRHRKVYNEKAAGRQPKSKRMASLIAMFEKA